MRVRVGGSARERFRQAWLEAHRFLEAEEAMAHALGLTSIDPVDGPPDIPFAPPDAEPAHERVVRPAEERPGNVRRVAGRLVRDPSEGGTSRD